MLAFCPVFIREKRKRQNLCWMVIPSYLHLLGMSQVMREGGGGEIAFLLPAFLSVTTAAVEETFLGGGVILVYERCRRLSSSSFSWCTWAPTVFFCIHTCRSLSKMLTIEKNMTMKFTSPSETHGPINLTIGHGAEKEEEEALLFPWIYGLDQKNNRHPPLLFYARAWWCSQLEPIEMLVVWWRGNKSLCRSVFL